MVYEICAGLAAVAPPKITFDNLDEAAVHAEAHARQHGDCWVRSWRSKDLIALFVLQEDDSVDVLIRDRNLVEKLPW